ncbi:2-C-methyl-D-erythritol 4-phosphate cytidylyltransferase [Tsukamurella paurometabola]|uniref:2-C-methyl-D-erythritol 4-phosphate cytidylyltransferase n=1 Tax=Tsukamurella paurometabola (strain ATCC 8368 / DSM 20162 / CCUG 35730 / CIP 100753 / JCM 10117 / KCTC 9821 / NBRC 16120 / NCIMB 702349 / NCTC 13040) TaxID=521096 RepID=D5USV3_TSUPD|nr:2-C-methyl-D-erythritol 4-phosphate cytidylyltransferase [Tsukamurella paurometabola]ADG77240.1 2-C-methyl-D-erythritol 4-phosphate cytidylyltransferase [Tsukamurella paurometabola DSM 20162]
MTVVALVPAAGQGTRLGLNRPKAFVTLQGRSLLERAVDGLFASGAVDEVVVMVPADLVDDARALVPRARVVVGGAERTDSVRAGLAAAGDADLVLVHDAARPLTPGPMIHRVVAALREGASAVIPVLPVADTIKRVDAGGAVAATVDRADLRAVQTPQGFTAQALRAAYDAAPNESATDDAGLVERAGGTVATVTGDPLAMKITTAFDLRIAEVLAQEHK